MDWNWEQIELRYPRLQGIRPNSRNIAPLRQADDLVEEKHLELEDQIDYKAGTALPEAGPSL
jgi:hypothetical protein